MANLPHDRLPTPPPPPIPESQPLSDFQLDLLAVLQSAELALMAVPCPASHRQQFEQLHGLIGAGQRLCRHPVP